MAKISTAFWNFGDVARQRMTVKEWREVLLNEEDRPMIRGHLRQLVATRLGAGIVEVRLMPLKES